MGLSRTLYSSINKALADTSTALRSHASEVHNFMRQITGASHGTSGVNGAPPSSSNWTVHSSHACGVGAGAGNNFSAAFTAAEWLRAAAGSTHAWIVFQSPSTLLGGTHYVTVSLGTASDQNAVYKISRTAPSGGTTTADPTSAVESTYGTGQQTHPTGTTAGKTHLVIDADGNFMFWCSKNGSTYTNLWLAVFGTVEAHAGDSYKTFLAVSFLDSGRGAPAMTSTITVRGLHLDGTAISTTNVHIAYLAVNSSSSLQAAVTQLHGSDSTVDAFPCAYVVSTAAGLMGSRGRIPDVWLVGTGQANAAGDPSGAAPTRVSLGGLTTAMDVIPVL